MKKISAFEGLKPESKNTRKSRAVHRKEDKTTGRRMSDKVHSNGSHKRQTDENGEEDTVYHPETR